MDDFPLFSRVRQKISENKVFFLRLCGKWWFLYRTKNWSLQCHGPRAGGNPWARAHVSFIFSPSDVLPCTISCIASLIICPPFAWIMQNITTREVRSSDRNELGWSQHTAWAVIKSSRTKLELWTFFTREVFFILRAELPLYFHFFFLTSNELLNGRKKLFFMLGFLSDTFSWFLNQKGSKNPEKRYTTAVGCIPDWERNLERLIDCSFTVRVSQNDLDSRTNWQGHTGAQGYWTKHSATVTSMHFYSGLSPCDNLFYFWLFPSLTGRSVESICMSTSLNFIKGAWFIFSYILLF